MKLNFKSVGAIVALTLAASAAHANGLIGPGATTGSDLVLDVWDGTASGVTEDLGIQVSNFNPTTSFSITLNSAVVADYNAADDEDAWNVVGAQSSSKTLLTTSTSSTVSSGDTSSGIGLAVAQYAALYPVIAGSTGTGITNTFATSTTGTVSGLSSTSNGGAGWTGSLTQGAGNISDTTDQFADTSPDESGQPPATLDFLKLVSGGSSSAYQGYWELVFNGAVGAATTGTLEWISTSVSSVPLPAAVWLLGSGLLGLAGISRRRASNSAPGSNFAAV